MGKVYLRPSSRPIYIATLSAEAYDELSDSGELDYQLDLAISDAILDIDYELTYEEDE